MSRAKAAGFEALMLTVDVPVAGNRLARRRNGFSIPPTLTMKTIADIATHPAWWANLLTTPPLTFASLARWDRTIAELIDLLFDPTMTMADLEWVRGCWDGPLIIKGIQSVDDATENGGRRRRRIVLSNHGGRQLGPSAGPAQPRPRGG